MSADIYFLENFREEVDDHDLALTCGNCGSVTFNLLKSNSIECSCCQRLIDREHYGKPT